MMTLQDTIKKPAAKEKSFIDACIDTIRHKSFINAYHKMVELVPAVNGEQKGRSYRLRHKVYCEENGYECPAKGGSYVEKDQYDDRSMHYILKHKISNEIIGTIRVILPDDAKPGESFPIQTASDHPLLKYDSRITSLCEISRFCTAPRFRKRSGDGKFLSSYHEQDDFNTQTTLKKLKDVTFSRRRIPYVQAALLQGAFEAAMQARIMDCVWMVEPSHIRSLNRIGLVYRVLGSKVSIHGGLQPIIFNIKHVLDNMRSHAPHCWEIISDEGRLQDMADELCQNDWQDRLIDDECWDQIYDTLKS